MSKIKMIISALYEDKVLNAEEIQALALQLESIYDESNDYYKVALLSQALMFKANNNFDILAKLLNEVLDESLIEDELLEEYNISSRGFIYNYIYHSHYREIAVYNSFVNVHKALKVPRMILIENLIADNRLEEAKDAIYDSFLNVCGKLLEFQFYEGEILYKKGLVNEAIELWNMITAKNEGRKANLILANLYAKYALYDIAIIYYKKAYNLQQGKKSIEELLALSVLYEIKKDYSKAIYYVLEIIKVYNDDYQIKSGHKINAQESRIAYLKVLQ